MPALITGGNGQLGLELQKLLPDAIPTDSTELDITDAAAVQAYDWTGITAIYNAAAYTNVDGAEAHPLLADKVNHVGVTHLAAIATKLDIPLIHISTDYVFDGTATEPYREDAQVNPQSVYGKTKALSEAAANTVPKHYTIRTSWVYGEGNNFVRTMLRLGREKDELTIVSDQLGRPTLAKDLAEAIMHLVTSSAPYGTYHFQNGGEVISWAEFASAIFSDGGITCTVTPITTDAYTEGKTGIAPRPAYGALALDKIKSVGISPRPWQAALKEYIKQETNV